MRSSCQVCGGLAEHFAISFTEKPHLVQGICNRYRIGIRKNDRMRPAMRLVIYLDRIVESELVLGQELSDWASIGIR